MDPIEEHPIRRLDAQGSRAMVDPVATEARIELDVNDGQYQLAFLCLPRELEALAVGFLLGEGALRRREDLAAVEADVAAGRVAVRGDFDADVLEAIFRRWTWGTGCGGGGTGRDLDAPAHRAVGPGPVVTPQRLRELAGEFHARAELWRRTGGVHACALAGVDGIVVFAEDIGRHNAFDKVVGRAFLDGLALEERFVLTTGRLTAEIVSKAVACGVAMLASRSAVTALAVRLARRFGVTLVGFLRGQRMNVYSGFQRIAPPGGGLGQQGQGQ